MASYVETNLNTILNEIQQRKIAILKENSNLFPMIENDKYLLSKQIVIQFLRHPNIRKKNSSYTEYFYPKMLRLFKEGLSNELNNPNIAELDIGFEIDEVVDHATNTFLNDEIISSFATNLSKNIWSFVYSPENKFMTSDNPVVCIQQSPDERPLQCGFNSKGAIKFYALSPDLLLIMMDENLTSGIDCKFGIATELCISTYHNALFAQSQEIYSYNEFDNNCII